MPDTRKEKLAIAMGALQDAKKDMTEEELRQYLTRRLQGVGESSQPKKLMPQQQEVEEIAPEIYEENDPRLKPVPLPQIGEPANEVENLPNDMSKKGKVRTLPFITRKKSKLYEMMQ